MTINKKEYMREYLGYKNISSKDDKIITGLSRSYSPLKVLDFCKEIAKVDSFEPIELDEVKEEAIKFYDKYFDVHDVRHVSSRDMQNFLSNLKRFSSNEDFVNVYSSLVKIISPFDLPVKLERGHAMVGEITKPIAIIEGFNKLEDREVQFDDIMLGNNLNKLSIATYIHEISHSQTESNIGYAEDYNNREVISIFLEKVAALDLDSTGKLLNAQERLRFAYIKHQLKALSKSKNLNDPSKKEDMIQGYMYLNSTLIATKLFDDYINSDKKEEYISGVQDVFDGKKTVEEFLVNKNVDIDNSFDNEIIKKHIKAM